MNLINLDKNLKFGMFWDVTFLNYLDTLHHTRYNIVNILFKDFIHRLEVYRDKSKPEIIIEYSDCIKYRIKAIDGNIESTLSDFNTSCDDIIEGKLVITKRSSHLLELIDAINILFGVRRISLIDAATPRKYMNIYIEKNNTDQIMQDIDLSIYMVMKYNQTFYERYDYQFCDSELDYATHKNLLKNFDFKTFYRLLSYDHQKIVDKRLKYLDNDNDFKYLGDFYVNAYDQLDARNSKRRLLQLQSLLFNKNYPWFSMVNVLTSKKRCMEKLYT